MMNLVKILFLCVLVESSKLRKSWQIDPLITYIQYGKGQKHVPVVYKYKEEKNDQQTLLFQTLFRYLNITGDKSLRQVRKNLQTTLKPVLRICSYDNPCGKKTKEESCEVKKDTCEVEKKDSCEIEKKNSCEEDKQETCKQEENKQTCEEKKIDKRKVKKDKGNGKRG